MLNRRVARGLLLLILFAMAPPTSADKVIHTTDWLDDEATKVILQRMNLNNLFPCYVEGRSTGLNLEYKVDYCYFKSGMRSFYSRWGLTKQQYDRYTEFYKGNRYAEYSQSTFDDAGNTLYQVTWIEWTVKQARSADTR